MPERRAPLFTSRVGRRVVVLFISCVLLPVLTLGWAILSSGSDRLRAEFLAQLRETAKAQGMAIVERLELADLELSALAADPPDRMPPIKANRWSRRFDGIGVRGGAAAPRMLLGESAPPPELTSAQRDHLAGGNPLLLRSWSEGGAVRLYLVRTVASEQDQDREIWACLRTDHVIDAQGVAAKQVLTVLDARGDIISSTGRVAGVDADTLRDALRRAGRGLATVGEGDDRSVAVAWQIFLKARYGAQTWRAVVSMRETVYAGPVNRFRFELLGVLVLALAGVLLLGLLQIRGTLRPIAILQEGTRAIARQEFDRPVQLASGDEFEELAHSLNQMAANLGRQFELLDTIAAVNRTVIVSLDRRAILDQVVRRLPGVARCDVAAIALFEQPEGTTRVVIHAVDGWGSTRAERTDERALAAVELFPEETLRKPDDLPGFFAPLRDHGLASVLLLPLRQEDRPVGLLACGYADDVVPDEETRDAIRNVANQMLVGVANAGLVQGLERMSWGTLTALARAIDAKSKWTSGHSERVMLLATAIARNLGVTSRRLENLRRAALLHDVGKIGTPIEVLDKPTALTKAEKRVMNEHVELGCAILEPIEEFRDAVTIIRQHHEKLDGSGYPAGLKGEQICFEARILSVADCFDAMRSLRPYRGCIPREKVLAHMRSMAGEELDPYVVAMLERVLEDQPELDPHDEESVAVDSERVR